MKLTKAQKSLLDKAAQHPVMADTDGYQFSNGESAHAGVVSRLIASGHLKPSMDGLFEGFTQTYQVSQ